jgi:hypothetical protein
MYITPEIIDEVAGCCHCAIIYDSDTDFGTISLIEPEVFAQPVVLPSAKIDSERLAHLSLQQRVELLQVLDEFPDVFSDTPGLCTEVEHEIPLIDGFKPRVMRAYKVPENYRAEVDRQIAELLRLKFIEPSNSPQVSPLVCVLKPPDSEGKRAVRICVDFRYVNAHTQSSASVLEDITDIIQHVGNSQFISKFDANSGYHQCPVKKEDRWLTAFVHGTSVYQFTRVPFGMKASGDTFVRSFRRVLAPVNRFTKTFVDDCAVHSSSWRNHLIEIRLFLTAVQKSGFTLGLKKCDFAKSSIRFVGHIIGSGKRSVDAEKVYDAMLKLKEPETKKQVRRIIGFFSFWRDYLPSFSSIAKPLTDLTTKRVPERIPFRDKERAALNELKRLLCEAVNKPLSIIDMSKPFVIYVDASNFAVGACMTQISEEGERPVAFASSKFNSTQERWATIHKEAYAALWALQKFKHWIFGKNVIMYSDHNPITFLTETAPKSAKLMRWALAIQEFDVIFRYRKGSTNVVADCLSRDVCTGDDGM